MELISNWNDFRYGVERVPRKDNAWITSIYASRDQIESWIKDRSFFSLYYNNATLFLRQRFEFFYLFHVASDHEKLAAGLRDLPENITLIADLIDASSNIVATLKPYELAGFVRRKRLIRMVRNKIDYVPVIQEDVEIAKSSLLTEIKSLLDRQLDPYVEQLPSCIELLKYIERSQVLVVRVKKITCGILIYERKGATAHLKFWHVHSDFQGRGIGRRLLDAFFSICGDANRFILWVIADNLRSIGIYNRYGFHADGLVDEIMMRKGK